MHLSSDRSQSTSKCGKEHQWHTRLSPRVPLFCSYHILTSFGRRATAQDIRIPESASLVRFFVTCYSSLVSDHSVHGMSTICLSVSSEVLKSLTSFSQCNLQICSPFLTTDHFIYSFFWFPPLHELTLTKLSLLSNCFSGYFKCCGVKMFLRLVLLILVKHLLKMIVLFF